MLDACLGALAASDLSGFEVLVVDDGSTEELAPIAAKYGYGYMKIGGPGGPARARNRGAEKVSGTHVAFIDADVRVHVDTLSRMVAAFEDDAALDAVMGTYDDEPGDRGFVSQFKNLFHRFVHEQFDGPVQSFWSGCGAMRRDAFLEFGGFDEKRYDRPAIEDIELGTWMGIAGRRIVIDRRIQCCHQKRWTLWQWIKIDLTCRGIPWTGLMMRAGRMANTLNVSRAQQISVGLVGLALIGLLVGFVTPWAWWAAGLAAVLMTLLNHGFYRFFLKQRGAVFTLGVIPLHWIYFIICGLSFVLGAWRHWASGDRHAEPSRAAQIAMAAAQAGR